MNVTRSSGLLNCYITTSTHAIIIYYFQASIESGMGIFDWRGDLQLENRQVRNKIATPGSLFRSKYKNGWL